jgi:carboxyvinyl-carboxyphosphonate phosphorylmutase
MSTVQAAYETLKSLRDGVAPRDLKNLPSPELMKRVTRQSDYAAWIKDFLGGAK